MKSSGTKWGSRREGDGPTTPEYVFHGYRSWRSCLAKEAQCGEGMVVERRLREAVENTETMYMNAMNLGPSVRNQSVNNEQGKAGYSQSSPEVVGDVVATTAQEASMDSLAFFCACDGGRGQKTEDGGRLSTKRRSRASLLSEGERACVSCQLDVESTTTILT